MQLFAHLPAGLLRRLRTVLRLAIPTAVAADTARSIVVTYQLAQQRFQEWEEEDRQEVREHVRELMRRVARRCEAADRDFWPAALKLSAPAATAPQAAASSDAAAADALVAADVWQLVGLAHAAGGVEQQAQQAMATLAQQHPSSAADWGDAEAQQLLRFEQGEAAAAQAAAARGVAAGATLVVVTLNDALAQVAGELGGLSLPWTTLLSRPPPPGVVRVTLSDVVAILGATPPARAAAAGGDKLGRRLQAVVDGVAATARAALPVPQMQLSRKSALRCAVEWHGWPEAPTPPLERDLSCC